MAAGEFNFVFLIEFGNKQYWIPTPFLNKEGQHMVLLQVTTTNGFRVVINFVYESFNSDSNVTPLSNRSGL